jgi:hypothetical protein
MPRPSIRTAALAALLLAVPGLAACGESSEEKANKQVCSSVTEIKNELKKLEGLTISTSFPTEAKASVESIGKSVEKIKEQAPKLSPEHKEEVEAANKAFATEIATITAAVVSASKSSNLQTGLKGAESQIKAALEKLATGYQKAFEGLKC